MNQTLKQEHATEIKEIQLNHETRMAKIMAQLNDLKETVVDL